jgi:dihydroxy-acid dehydratase
VSHPGTPRIGVFDPAVSGYADLVREAGGETLFLGLPGVRPAGGVALYREWVADWVQISSSGKDLDALFVSTPEPAELAGLLVAALRLDLPAVVAAPPASPFTVALAALGFAPPTKDPVDAAVELAGEGGPRSRELVGGFSLANALRVGLSLGAGPELLVHLAAIAREAEEVGFPQMVRVLAPENPAVTTPHSPWFEKYGVAGLLAHLGTSLHDTPTVAGRLTEALPSAPPAPAAVGSRLVSVRGRASGTEAICRVDEEAGAEVSGSCRFYASEEATVRAVGDGAVSPTDLLVVGGCGPRGGPGLLRLDRLGRALDDTGLAVPVLTDGLSPEGVAGTWASLATPEAAVGGVIGRLRDGDPLRLDLTEGLILTGVKAHDFGRREHFAAPDSSGFGYVVRYARTALPALEGAGFG